MTSIETIAIAGSGNVAFHLGRAFKEAGIGITGVYGRNPEKRAELANSFGATQIERPSELKADLILICVKDEAIEEVSNAIRSDLFVAHTSGSIHLNALNSHEKAGVLYPLQTISRDVQLDLTTAPILIEATDSKDLKLLAELSARISEDIQVVTSEDRETLHMAAVMVNNFTNHLVVTAKLILEEKGLDWKLLLPLLNETTKKLMNTDPELAQTGPAKRGDLKTIEKHLANLTESDQILYKLFSERIAEQKTKTP